MPRACPCFVSPWLSPGAVLRAACLAALVIAAPGAARGADPSEPASAPQLAPGDGALGLRLAPSVTGVDAERLRSAVASELEVDVAILAETVESGRPAAGALVVTEPRPGVLALSYEHDGEPPISREIVRATDGTADEELLALLAGNLVRSEADELLARLRQRRAERLAAPGATSSSATSPAPSEPASATTSSAAATDPSPDRSSAAPKGRRRAPASRSEQPTEQTGYVSIFHPVAIPSTDDVTAAVGLSLLYGRVQTLRGVLVGTGVTRIDRALRGASVAAVANRIDGPSGGVAFAGGMNWVEASMHGAQVAGVLNLQRGVFRGAQIAPVNLALGRGSPPLHGLQLGSVNVAGDTEGAQLGVVNVGGRVRGAQIGVINVAGRHRGAQVGAINVARDHRGAQVGLIGTHSRVDMDLALWGSSDLPFNLGLKMRAGWIYVLPSVGYDEGEGDQRTVAPGLAVGVQLPAWPLWFAADLGAAGEVPLDSSGGQPEPARTPTPVALHYRAVLGAEIAPWLDLFGGVGARHQLPANGFEQGLGAYGFGGVQLF